MKVSRLFLLFFAVSLSAQDAAELIQKAVDVLGGKTAVEKFRDYRADGSMTMSMYGREFSGKLSRIQKAEKMWLKMEVQFGSNLYVVSQAYNGKTAFSDRQGTIVDLPALNYQSDADHSLALLIAENTSPKIVRKTEIDGRPVFGVELTKDGKKTTFYIDESNYTVREMVFEDDYFGENQTKETLEKKNRYDDYTETDGVNFPGKMIFFEKGIKQSEFLIESVTFGPAVKPELFERPNQDLDLRYSEERLN